MGNISAKIEHNLRKRQDAYDALSQIKKQGRKRPGSSKKKGK